MTPSRSRECDVIVKITDVELNDLYSNDVLADLGGYEPVELERIGWINVLDPQARSLMEEMTRSVAQTPYLQECFDTNIICSDGSTRTLAWEVTALHPQQFPVMLITARESSKKQVVGTVPFQSEELPSIPNRLWNEIFDSLSDCVSIHDENYTVLAANKALCERLGMPRSEIVGRKCHEVFHGSKTPDEDCVMVQALSGKPGKRVRRESYENKIGGICQIEAAGIASTKAVLHGVVHTVREEQDLVGEASQMSRRMIDRQSHLANAIAHDYNNLMSGVVGYSGMLRMLPDLPEKAQRYVEELQKASARLQELTQRLLLFGRRRKPHGQAVDLSRLVEATLRSPDWLTGAEGVHFEKSAEPVRVEADPTQIQGAVANLVENALEAVSGEAEDVFIRTGMHRPDEPFETCFGRAPAGVYGCIEVRDGGLGIDEKQMKRLFQPCSSSKHRQLGRGFGLPIVYRIVQNHKGYMHVESERGVGTCFRLFFPESQPEANASTAG